MRLLITGFPGWLTNRFLETLPEYPTSFDHIRALVRPGSRIPPEFASMVEIVEGELTQPGTLAGIGADIDVVLHAAGVLHVKKIKDFYRINRDGTKHLLDACVQGNADKILYVSTNAAQGFCKGPGDELVETDPCRPASHYGKSKYQAEELIRRYHGEGMIKGVIVRPAMFYGPPVAQRHVEIFKKVLHGRFPVFGSGEYLRSLTYIDNLIQGIHLCLTKPQAEGQTYYITDREIPTLNQIIDAMAEALGTQVELIHLPKWIARAALFVDEALNAFDLYWMTPHLVGESCKNIACRISKAEQELGYDPKISLREGYRRSIVWCRERGLL